MPRTIRDAGFIFGEPGAHRLILLTARDSGGRDELRERFRRATDEFLSQSGVIGMTLDADGPLPPGIAAHLAENPPPGLPAVMLLAARGWGGRSYHAAYAPEHGPALLAGRIEAAVRSAVVSPVRTELLRILPERSCAVVLLTGLDPAENERVRKIVAAVAGEVSDPPVTIFLSRDDAEWAFRLTSGLWHGADDPRPYLAVFFGRGRRLGPVLGGVDLPITAGSLAELIALLDRDAASLPDPAYAFGPHVPLEWDVKASTRAVLRLGFDPDVFAQSMSWADVFGGEAEKSFEAIRP